MNEVCSSLKFIIYQEIGSTYIKFWLQNYIVKICLYMIK
uniref:Uncharacterized protein n=1 Tax=Anguilla anguilla TaxID=7936 RepID=A0A0E9UHK7_ANGAN